MEFSDFWFVAALALAALFFMLYVRLGETTATQFARAHLRRVRDDGWPEKLVELDESDFVSLYLLVRRRRDPLYFIGFLMIAGGTTVFTLMIASLVRQIADPGPLVWQFLTYFSVIAAWVLSVVATLWLYQARKTRALSFWLARRSNPASSDSNDVH